MADSSTRGLYNKYVVRRTDGTDELGGKHYGCTYFVLDLEHDPHEGGTRRLREKLRQDASGACA